jgi:ABC-type phosphate transport system substrate-binding protein
MNVLAVAIMLLAALIVPARAEVIRVLGSTTFTSELMVPHQIEIEHLSRQSILVLPSRSNLGIFGLFEGNQLAMISSSMNELLDELKREKPGLAYDRLQVFHITKTRAVFSVNRLNPVQFSDLKSIARILDGTVTSWRQLGGADLPIRLVMVREGGGVQAAIEGQLHLRVTASNPIFVELTAQVNKVVERLPEALGLAQFETLRQGDVVELKTDRPIVQELNLVTLGEPSPAVRAVIDAVRKVVGSHTGQPSDTTQ